MATVIVPPPAEGVDDGGRLTWPAAVLACAWWEAWARRGSEMLVGILTALLSALIAGVAGHWDVAAWIGLAGFPAAFVVLYGHHVARNTMGRNAAWVHDTIEMRTVRGPCAHVRIQRRMVSIAAMPGLRCKVRDPGGQWHGGHVKIWPRPNIAYAAWPDDFTSAMALLDGRYRVVWWKRTGSSWRVAVAYTFEWTTD